MASVNFRVDYLVEDGFGRKEPRYVEVPFQDIPQDMKERLAERDPKLMLSNEYFQEELLRHFELNGHLVKPLDFEQGMFTSKVENDPHFKAEIQITQITFDKDYEERSKRQADMLLNRIKRS